jgi:hypothetical protein
MWSTHDSSVWSSGSTFTGLGQSAQVTSPDTARHERSVPSQSRVDDCTVELQLGQPHLFRLFGKHAAIPTVSVHESASFRTLEIGVPGADASNTEAYWDEAKQRLSVGVWCGRTPLFKLPMSLPLPELAWLRSFHLPVHLGHLAKIQVGRGTIRIQVPSEAAATSLAEDVAPTRRADPESNLIPFPARSALTGSAGVSSAANGSDKPSSLASACRWLGISICLALCLPILLFCFFLFGFVLLPLLPLIGASLVASLGGGPSAPPARPHLPAAAASAPPAAQAQAA